MRGRTQVKAIALYFVFSLCEAPEYVLLGRVSLCEKCEQRSSLSNLNSRQTKSLEVAPGIVLLRELITVFKPSPKLYHNIKAIFKPARF
ncbi:hypothetical protein B0H14DRAFT_2941757 [Mycena olivaceomarginata]|nr:hypothetical protein B0H14DRAFT_2941757 [Mycena olivaceomarginata]